jgi:geranylgeranyl diphosphate synthase type I
MWHDGQITCSTLDWLQAFIERRAATTDQVRLLTLGVEEARVQAAILPSGMPSAEIPIAVYAAAGGGEPWPLAGAAACLCVYLGADLLDNVVDHEISSRWTNVGANQVILAAVTIGSALSMACLHELDVPVDRLAVMQRVLLDTMLAMSAGESADVAFEGRDDVSIDACEAMVLAKSGAECELFARIGALLAGAPPAVCDAYATFGRELGAAIQIISDCADLVEGGPGHDFSAHKRTLPIVHALSTLSGGKRAELIGHLDASGRDLESRKAARSVLLATGSFKFATLVAQVHRQRARAALRSARPSELAGKHLFELADGNGTVRPNKATADA